MPLQGGWRFCSRCGRVGDRSVGQIAESGCHHMYTMWGDYCVFCGYDRTPVWRMHKSVRRPLSLLVATAGLALVAWPLLCWAGLWPDVEPDLDVVQVFSLFAGVALVWLAINGWQGKKPDDDNPPDPGSGDGKGRYPGLIMRI